MDELQTLTLLLCTLLGLPCTVAIEFLEGLTCIIAKEFSEV